MTSVSEFMACDPHELETFVEHASGRLREINTLLFLIDFAGLLVELPEEAQARQLHQCGVSMLAVASREVADLIKEIDQVALGSSTEVSGRRLDS
jgi:hypothetical protein